MKRFKKLFSVAIMFALCLTFALISPISHIFTVLAATTTIGAVLTIKGLKDKGEIGTKIKIPKAKAGSKSVTVVVKDPRGVEVLKETYTSGSVGDDDYFEVTPSVVGYYSVNYVVEEDITKSQTYYIYVDGTRPVIEFAKNAEVYLPEKIYADNMKVELPKPVVKNSDAQEVDYELLIKGEVSASEKEKVTVSAIDPNYNDVTLTREDGKIFFEASKKDNKYVYGAYTFTYFYEQNGLTAKKYATVYVDKDYKEVADKVNMTFVWTDGSSMPTSGVLGQELTLPRPVAQDKSRDNAKIQSYTQVKVDFIKNGNLDNAENWISYNGTEDKDFDADTFSFIPMDKTENGGYYRIEYTITDYFGHKIDKQVYQIKNVRDTVKPDVYLVNSYTLEDAAQGNVDLTDMSYLVPNKVIIASDYDIVLPAIYGIDNYATFDNLTMGRYFVSGSTSYRLDKATDGKYNTNETITISSTSEDTPEAVRNLLKTAGTYQIRYEVEDGVNTNKTVTYDLVIVERDFMDNVAPRITMPTISNVGLVGETISFSAPDVKDYASDSLQEANIDTARCNVEVGYFYGTSTEYNEFLDKFNKGYLISECANSSKYKAIEFDKETKKYTFEVPAVVAGAELKVVVRATDNAKYGLPNTSTVAQNNISVKDASVRVINVDNHTTVPTFELSQIKTDIEEFDQNAVIKLISSNSNGEFVFANENADFTDISVKVYDPNGKEVSVRGASTVVNNDNTQISVNGAEFTSTRYGKYVVTITATDIAGNSTVVAYELTVKNTVKPVINSASSLPQNVVVGQEVVIPNGIALDNGERIELQDANSISFDSADLDGYTNPEFSFVRATKTFTPKQAGTYKFVYVYTNSRFTVKSDIIEIQVAEDTSNEGKVKFNESEWYETANLVPVMEDEVETGKYSLIAIPYLDVNAKVKSYSVKVQGPDNQDIAVTLKADIIDNTLLINQERFESVYGAFEPTAKDGEYKVIYTVETESGTTSITKTLRVGDLKEPTIVIGNLDTNLPTNAKLGSEIKIKASDIELSDEVTSQNDIKLVVTIKETDGTAKTLSKDSDGYYTYKFESAGSYVLKYTATDKAGNSAEKQTTIVVSAESAKETNTAVIWGTVLIVLCVAVCGSVITFFIVNNRKKPSNDKTKTK